MEAKKTILTKAGYDKLQEELQDLRVVRRSEVAEKIKEAREQGDLSENAEYDAAKDEQREIEARIGEIENILTNVEIVDNVDYDKVGVGCKVRVYVYSVDAEKEYTIVGSSEVNSLKGKISNESPIGSALMGARVGDEVEVEVPVGIMKYKILEIKEMD